MQSVTWPCCLALLLSGLVIGLLVLLLICGPGFSPSLGRRSGSSGTLSTLCVLLPWCSAADGGTAARHPPVLRHTSLPVPGRSSKCPRSCPRYAAGGTAGGSTDDHILFLIATDRGSERRHSHSNPRLPASVSSSTLAAQLEDAPVLDSIEWVQLNDGVTGKTYVWNRRTRATVWKSQPGVKVVCVGERTEEGGSWYWHRGTLVSTYDFPPLPPG